MEFEKKFEELLSGCEKAREELANALEVFLWGDGNQWSCICGNRLAPLWRNNLLGRVLTAIGPADRFRDVINSAYKNRWWPHLGKEEICFLDERGTLHFPGDWAAKGEVGACLRTRALLAAIMAVRFRAI